MIAGILIAGILNFEWSTDTINNIWERYRFNVFSCRSHFGLGHNKCTTCPSVSNVWADILKFIIESWALSRIINQIIQDNILWVNNKQIHKSCQNDTFFIKYDCYVGENSSSSSWPPSICENWIYTVYTGSPTVLDVTKCQCDKIWSDVTKHLPGKFLVWKLSIGKGRMRVLLLLPITIIPAIFSCAAYGGFKFVNKHQLL